MVTAESFLPMMVAQPVSDTNQAKGLLPFSFDPRLNSKTNFCKPSRGESLFALVKP